VFGFFFFLGGLGGGVFFSGLVGLGLGGGVFVFLGGGLGGGGFLGGKRKLLSPDRAMAHIKFQPSAHPFTWAPSKRLPLPPLTTTVAYL